MTAEAAIDPESQPLSKRAARRLIQRAFVLLARDRHVRQQFREARAVTLWVLADWDFAWTVEFDRGKVGFERRPSKRPDVTITWRTAEDFFRHARSGKLNQDNLEMTGKLDLKKLAHTVCQEFVRKLGGVLESPFDDAGNPLA